MEESLHKTKKQDHLVNSIGSMEISEELGAETSSEFYISILFIHT